MVLRKGSKWYPADDIRKPVPSRKHNHKRTKLRAKLSPGSVVIMIAGVYRGRRAIFLKQLSSGMLLVTGPFSVNGIPLRRVDQAYVIVTSTIVDVSKVDVSKFDDPYFRRSKVKQDPELMEEESASPPPKKVLTEERIADQKVVDQVLEPVINKEPLLLSYLKSKFSLGKGQYPHQMKF